MSQIVNRMYGSQENAEAAVAALKHYGYGEIYLVSPDAGDIDAITEAITRSNVIKWKAKIFARGVADGGSLVIVHALFGTALGASEILDEYDPIDSGYEEPAEPPREWDEAAPLSSAFGIPTIIRDPAPLSRVLGLPLLTSDKAPLSGLFGLPTVISNEAPLSRLIGLRMLTSPDASLSKLLGLPLLTKSR